MADSEVIANGVEVPEGDLISLDNEIVEKMAQPEKAEEGADEKEAEDVPPEEAQDEENQVGCVTRKGP